MNTSHPVLDGCCEIKNKVWKGEGQLALSLWTSQAMQKMLEDHGGYKTFY